MALAAPPRPLTERSAQELAAAIRAGELRSREVVEAHLDLIERRNGRLNALVADRFPAALPEADAPTHEIVALLRTAGAAGARRLRPPRGGTATPRAAGGPRRAGAAAAGLVAPTGPVATDYRDLDALRTSTRLLMRQGFRARSAIHPAQVAVINEVLTPSDDEVTRAREQIAAFEAAGGGPTGDDGTMVDAATVRVARDVLARAGAAGVV